jgi:hypothetical protein
MVAMGPGEIDKWDLGCAAGDHSNHVSYRVVEAADLNAARSIIPQSARSQAQVMEVGKISEAQVRAYHAN